MAGGIARQTKMCMSVFSFIPQWNKKNQLSILIISNHFDAKLKDKQLRNEVKFKLIRKRKNKLTNSQGWMIIQLRAAIFERIQNVQIQALQPVSIRLLSLSFYKCMHFSSLIQTLPMSCCLQWRNARFCNMLFDVMSCYWKSLSKMPSALFGLEHFSFIELWTKPFNQWNCRKTNEHTENYIILLYN